MQLVESHAPSSEKIIITMCCACAFKMRILYVEHRRMRTCEGANVDRCSKKETINHRKGEAPSRFIYVSSNLIHVGSTFPSSSSRNCCSARKAFFCLSLHDRTGRRCDPIQRISARILDGEILVTISRRYSGSERSFCIYPLDSSSSMP